MPIHPYLTRITLLLFFFFNDTATTEIYTLSLHDALPIFSNSSTRIARKRRRSPGASRQGGSRRDRKSTRLNSSHPSISYAVFCLKKKKKYGERRRSWRSGTKQSVRPPTVAFATCERPHGR